MERSKNKFRTYYMLFLPGALVLLLVSACGTFPEPGKNSSSMCIIIVEPSDVSLPVNESDKESDTSILRFTGPTEFEIGLNRGSGRKAVYTSVPAGNYRVYDRRGGQVWNFNIPEDTIFLLQQKLNSEGELVPLKAEDRRWVSENMELYINFYDWYGKIFAGFGPYVPRFTLDEVRYEFKVSSEPEGARLSIDGREWGPTPQTAKLEEGKHHLRLELAGFEPIQRYINVQGKSELNLRLEKRSEPEQKEDEEEGEEEQKEVYRMLVLPLRNTGGAEYDHIGTLFADGIELGLYNRKNVDLIRRSDIEEKPARAEMELAEEFGAELLVAGSYFVKEGTISVHTALYDVRSSQVKAATLSTGEAGLAMFDTIDFISREFLENMDKALPDVGKEVVEQQQIVTQELISYQKGASVQEMHTRRHEKKNSLSSLFYWGAMVYEPQIDMEGYEFAEGPNEDDETPGPTYWVTLQHERDFNRRFALNTRLVYPLKTSLTEGVGVQLYTGPQVLFPSERNEFVIAALGHLVYNPPSTYTAVTEGEHEEVEFDMGAILSFGLSLDAHLKVYLNERLDTRPRFLQFGLTWDEITGAYEFDTGELNRYVFGINLYFGYGVRL